MTEQREEGWLFDEKLVLRLTGALSWGRNLGVNRKQERTNQREVSDFLTFLFWLLAYAYCFDNY